MFTPDPNPLNVDEPDLGEACSMCGGDLWADGLEPSRDGTTWICGDCDQARNFTALDLD